MLIFLLWPLLTPSFSATRLLLPVLVAWSGATLLHGQIWLEFSPAVPESLPALIDSDAASFWKDGLLHAYSSTSHPVLNIFRRKFCDHLFGSHPGRFGSPFSHVD